MIRIKDWMTRDVKTCKESDSLYGIAKQMDKANIGCMIVAQGKKPIGIITERDLLRKVVAQGKDPKKLLAKDVMTKKLKVYQEDISLLEVTRAMNKYKFRRIIIVNENGDLAGLVTSTDLIKLVSV